MSEYPKYKFTCGCIVTIDGTLLINRRRRCREHWNRMELKLIKCQKCHEVFETSTSTTRALYCPKCRVGNDMEKRRAWQLARRKTTGPVSHRHTQAKPAAYQPKPVNYDVPIPGWRPDLNKAPCGQCPHMDQSKTSDPCCECAWPALYADSICEADIYTHEGYGGVRSKRILNPTMS